MNTTLKQPENRRAYRTEIDCSLKFNHKPSSKSLRGRCLNISETGALVIVPMQVPVIAGQTVEMSFSANGMEQLEKVNLEAPASHMTAVVTRIDRSNLLQDAGVRVGVEFRR
ncbi:MAG: PilZ domain-containing protein [Sedimentisphaerales bacterium]|nr:PilZ domain-containing protein [Sedimentisphaerales bacterium]